MIVAGVGKIISIYTGETDEIDAIRSIRGAFVEKRFAGGQQFDKRVDFTKLGKPGMTFRFGANCGLN